MMKLWKFTKIDRIEEMSFHKVLERFYDFGIVGLIRENIQNSLDGKIGSSDQPIIVKISTGKIKRKYIPGLDEVIERVKVLKGGNEYAENTIKHMKSSISFEEVNYITFEDSNTKGLKYNLSKNNTWNAYAYNKGLHCVEEDGEFEKSRGGSHGIGKIASNSASDIYLMYFANCDDKGNKHIGGTVQLVEHEFDNKFYRSTGYFTDMNSSDDFTPYNNKYTDIFKKDSRGLKLIIPYFREQFNSEEDIVRGVCDNFFVAINNGGLEVEVNNKKVNKTTLRSFIENPDYYAQDISEKKDEFTPLYYKTFTEEEKTQINIKDKKTDYHFDLYFKYDASIPKGRLGIIRSIGMKIEDRKIKGNINKPFNAIIIPQNTDSDYFLKTLENESHTKLSSEHIKNQESQKNAKRFINNIDRELSKIIEDYVRQHNPTDGVMDVEDILYDVENNFRKDLKSSNPIVKIGDGKKKKSVVKTKIKKKNPTDKKWTGQKVGGTRKVKKKVDQDGKKELINISPNIVQRAIIGNRELLNIDLSNEKSLEKTNFCDIRISLIDGMGKEYLNEFKINENYKKVVDTSSKNNILIDDNCLKNVPIVNGEIDIELDLNTGVNRALKFVYYLEV